MKLSKELQYTKDNSWVKIEERTATLGMVQELVDKAEEIVFIQLPKKGQNIKIGDVYASVESVKWSGTLTSPFEGVVIEVNDILFDEPELLNHDSYKNWVCKIAFTQKEVLLSAQEAEKMYGDKNE